MSGFGEADETMILGVELCSVRWDESHGCHGRLPSFFALQV